MKRQKPNFKNAQYVKVSRNWHRLSPVYHSKKATKIWSKTLPEYAECRDGSGKRFKPQDGKIYDAPEAFSYESWKWRISGPRAKYWKFVCQQACHWLADLNLFVACTVWPDQNWRILNGKQHTTVWNGDFKNPVLLDLNYIALRVDPAETIGRAWGGRMLRPRQFLKQRLHKQKL